MTAAGEEPRTTRPHMPGYGVPASLEGALSWEWASERLAASKNYWIASAGPGGRPHVMPVWGVWLDGALWFSTGANSRKAKNLAADSRCVATPEDAEEAVIVEGRAELVAAGAIPPQVPEAYAAKYEMPYPADSSVYAIQPGVVFGFIDSVETFGTTATRWLFDR